MNQLGNELEFYQLADHARFCKRFGTLCDLPEIRALTEKCTKYKNPIQFAFVDYRKAFWVYRDGKPQLDQKKNKHRWARI